MSEIGEAVGTVAEGGLYSRAIEKQAGEATTGAAVLHKGHFDEQSCLNCRTPLNGPHCHNCGQKAHLHRTIRAFMHDLLHGALHLDGKMWSTLPKLAFKPGELTRRYVAGERAKFVSPMALFLFGVFLMFGVFQIAGITPPSDLGPPVQAGEEGSPGEARDTGVLEEVRDGMTDGATERLGAQRDELAEQLAALGPGDPARAGLESELAALDAQIADANLAIKELQTVDPQKMSVDTPSEFVNHAVEKWQKNPGLMAYKLQSNGYKFSWLLIPLSVPFVWLMFAWRQQFRAYDHAIFVTYSLSFMTLFYVVLVLISAIGVSGSLLSIIGVLVPPIHIYKQLRGAYQLRRFSAFWRLLALSAFIWIVLLLFLWLLLMLGAF